MKEKIERFSKGDFEYEVPFICLSEEEIKITVEAGSSYEGSFVISNFVQREMKGIVYSSNRLMKINNPSFQGCSCTIHYSFHATHLKAGEVVQGEISVVSDCGEMTLPFYVDVEVAFINTSLGKIKDLFQFTNLARMDWSEAKKIFKREDFERIFLSNEERYRFIYRNLLKSISTSQALEEFLIAIRKKAMIRLTVDKTQVEYQIMEEGISDKLLLTKDHWGFAEIRVSTEAPFIILDQKFLWADRFISNTHQVSYSIDPRKLRPGINYGQILIRTVYQTIIVEVKCRYQKEQETNSQHRIYQKLELGLMVNYLHFRLNKCSLEAYIEEAEALLKKLPDREDSRWKSLIRLHLALVAGRQNEAMEELTRFQKEKEVLKRHSIVEYSAYLYLRALYEKTEEAIAESARIIRYYYENENDDWRILWILLNIDLSYGKSGGKKLSDIKEQYSKGCHSPILYYEAVCILNKEPVLLREMNDFEIHILNYGIKHWILSKELAQQYTYLAGKRKNYHPVIYRSLARLFDEYGDTDTLSAICCLLIKGLKKSEKYFEWYRRGVEAQLRITELYEYYMHSISCSVQLPLAQPVLLYFIYNSSISDRKKAFLYANIINNRNANESIYRSYIKRMEVFATKMLVAHQINRDLAVLYREFLTKGMLSSELARHLPYVMYRHELYCNNPNIVGVKVIHKELGLEDNQTLVKGYTQLDIFTGNAELFLIDSFGNYYTDSIDYDVTPYLNPEEYEKYCLEYSNHTMLLLHVFDRYQNQRIMNEDAAALRKQVLKLENLTEEYLKDCYQLLIEYYYENNDNVQLEHYLKCLDLNKIKPVERAKYMEYMVVRRMYYLALKALETFGFEGITVNRLVKLCSGWMVTPQADGKQELIVDLCYYVYSHGKYDEAILRYLVCYYEGSTKEMLGLWKAAKGFELDTHSLEERLLTYLLFIESDNPENHLVFFEYYREVTNHTLIRAYLSFYAYHYLVHEHIISEELFPVMRRELNYEENDICLLAWLKYNIHNNKLTEYERNYIELQLLRFVKKGIILPFFVEYRKQVALPEQLLDKYYITYITDPKNQVYIHFRVQKQPEQGYITERMPNVFLGIHVKEFILFYHETVQYYITEEYEQEGTITESFHALYDPEATVDEDSRFNQINLMLMAMELQDDNALLETMESYVQREYLVDTLFKPIIN